MSGPSEALDLCGFENWKFEIVTCCLCSHTTSQVWGGLFMLFSLKLLTDVVNIKGCLIKCDITQLKMLDVSEQLAFICCKNG